MCVCIFYIQYEVSILMIITDNFLFKGFQDTLHAIFCLAENSVGPKSTRPDDIFTLYSGK